MKPSWTEHIETWISTTMEFYFGFRPNTTNATIPSDLQERFQILDNIQKSLQCCGSESYKDWTAVNKSLSEDELAYALLYPFNGFNLCFFTKRVYICDYYSYLAGNTCARIMLVF